MTNIHAKQGLQTVGGFGVRRHVRRPRAGRGPDGEYFSVIVVQFIRLRAYLWQVWGGFLLKEIKREKEVS